MGRIARALVLAGVLVGTTVVFGASNASAATVSQPIASGFAGPLQFAVGSDGTLYVAQDFTGVLTAVDKKGKTTDIASNPGGELAGVAALGKGTVSYTTANYDPDTGVVTSSLLMRVMPNGKTSTLGDEFAHEQTANPDQINHYGFSDLSPSCAATVPDEVGGGDGYDGIFDTHPYAVAIASDGTRYIADAAGNDIVRVGPNRQVATVAVLPPQPLVLTSDIATGFGLDPCVVGHTYNFEPVPTDVEIGPNGLLYVTTLPGGPEDPSLGARGSVYSVNPTTGAVALVATGFSGATNLAVAPDGTIYVAELFAGQISKVVSGGPQPVVSLTDPAAVEWANGKLYASTDVFGNGSIVTITP